MKYLIKYRIRIWVDFTDGKYGKIYGPWVLIWSCNLIFRKYKKTNWGKVVKVHRIFLNSNMHAFVINTDVIWFSVRVRPQIPVIVGAFGVIIYECLAQWSMLIKMGSSYFSEHLCCHILISLNVKICIMIGSCQCPWYIYRLTFAFKY